MFLFIIAFFLLEGINNRRTQAQLRKPMIAFGIVMLVMVFTSVSLLSSAISVTSVESLIGFSNSRLTGYIFLFCLLALLLIYIWMFAMGKQKALHDYARYFLAFILILMAAGMILRWELANGMLILVILAFAFWVASVFYVAARSKAHQVKREENTSSKRKGVEGAS